MPTYGTSYNTVCRKKEQYGALQRKGLYGILNILRRKILIFNLQITCRLKELEFVVWGILPFMLTHPEERIFNKRIFLVNMKTSGKIKLMKLVHTIGHLGKNMRLG
jgi:hypothetical protein